jgi:hypothetical protein
MPVHHIIRKGSAIVLVFTLLLIAVSARGQDAVCAKRSAS